MSLTADAVRAALWMGLALGAFATAAPLAHAQTAAPSAEARRSYSIAAGPLGQVLNSFADAAGIELTADARLLEGKHSGGLSGSFTVEEGFSQLLRDQGLQVARSANGSYALGTAPAVAARQVEAEATLPVVKVTTQAVKDGTTEGAGSYTTPSMTSATKLPLSIRETPQSVTVITRDRMDDQAMIKVGDAIGTTPGMSITSLSGPNREVYYARGFQVENYTFDGLPATFVTGGQSLFNDLAIYDRVEVVRGAAGLTQGAGTPSAAINFVRKRPTPDFQASVQGQVGSWDHLGIEADVSGPLDVQGSLRGRLVARGWQSNSFQEVAREGRGLLYLIGEADLARNTVLTLSIAHQKNDSITTWAGLPTARDGSDLQLPRSTFLGNKWNYWDETNTSVFASLERRFDTGWKMNLSTHQIRSEQDMFVSGVYLNGAAYDQTGMKSVGPVDRASYDLNAQGPFSLFSRRHELVVGASMRVAEESSDVAGYWPPIPLASGIDIHNWTHDAAEPASVTEDFHGSKEERQRGVYATTRLNLSDSFRLIVGARLDSFKFGSVDDIYDGGAGTWSRNVDGYEYNRHLTKYAGVVYTVDAQHSVYASYTDIFKPQRERDVSNDFVRPILGKNYEAGVKGEYFGGALNVAAAVFRVDQSNLAMAVGSCPFNPSMTCYAPAGLVRSLGYELEAQGSLTPNWQIGGGYSYISAKVREDSDPALVGTRQNTHLPTRQLKLSTSYRLPDSPWRLGGNLRWQNKVDHTDDWDGYAYHTEQAAYALVDAMASYQHDKHLDIQFNVTNLFDKVYYRQINTQPVTWGGNALYGEPRRLMLTARYKF